MLLLSPLNPLKRVIYSGYLANFSLICIFPGLLFYQFLCGQFPEQIKPIFGSGWAITILVLFFCLSFCFFSKILHQRKTFVPIDYVFVSFLIFSFIVSVFNYFAPVDAQYERHLLYWHLSAIASNATCYMAFRLASLNNSFFLRIWRQLTVLSSLAVAYNMFDINAPFYIDKHFYFGFAPQDQLWSYQGFARSLLIIFAITIFNISSSALFVLFYILSSLILVANQSRTELVLFVCAIPAITFFLNSFEFKRKTLLATVTVLPIFVFLTILFSSQLQPLFDYFSNTRASSFLNLQDDASFQIRILQSITALNSILEAPVWGDYGSYFLESGETGNYPHNMLAVWMNLGIVGLLIYLVIIILIIRFLFDIDLQQNDKTKIYIASFLGLSAILAHTLSYTYCEVLMACAVGAIANVSEVKKATLIH